MRQAYKAIREGLLPEDKARFDACIEKALLDSMSVRYSGKILAYASLASEVETMKFCRKVLAGGRELYLPKSYPGGIMRFFAVGSLDELEKGAFGVLEPREAAKPSMYRARKSRISAWCRAFVLMCMAIGSATAKAITIAF